MNIVFAGSPEFAGDILLSLIGTAFQPKAVFTQPDSPKGRGRKLRPSAVKKIALEHDLTVLQPATLRKKSRNLPPEIAKQTALQAYQDLQKLRPDVFVVVAYGQILPQKILDLPSFGCINVHASILPRWRGAAPIERAAIAGDATTGISIMQMQAGLDTGPVLKTTSTPINFEHTIDELESTLALQGAQALHKILRKIAKLKTAQQSLTGLPRTDQDDHLATYAHKLESADRVIDWSDSAAKIRRQIWALSRRLPVRVKIGEVGMQLLDSQVIEQMPGSTNLHPTLGSVVDTTKLGITVQCATDLLQITKLKIEKGKGAVLSPAQALNGYPTLFTPGTVLSPFPI